MTAIQRFGGGGSTAENRVESLPHSPSSDAVLKALTIFQPWATLVMIGAKPDEFRKWDYRTRAPDLEGKRIMVHASARPVKLVEVEDIIARINQGVSSLVAEKAMPLLRRLQDAYRCQGVVELGAGLGTAVLGTPRLVEGPFNSPADSDRIEHHMWAWPLTDVKPLKEPIHCKGAQGFWNFPLGLARAA